MCAFDPWVGKISCSRKWQPSPVFLPEKFHGQRILVGYVSLGCKVLDMTNSTHTCSLQPLTATHCRGVYYTNDSKMGY